MKNIKDKINLSKLVDKALIIGTIPLIGFFLHNLKVDSIPGTNPAGYDTLGISKNDNREIQYLMERDKSNKYYRVDFIDSLGQNKKGLIYADFGNDGNFYAKYKFQEINGSLKLLGPVKSYSGNSKKIQEEIGF